MTALAQVISGAAIYRIGMAVLVTGAILANLAVSKMAKAVRLHWEIGYNSRANDRRSKNVIRRYRETHENGPLYRNLKFAYGVCGVGGAVTLAGILIAAKS